MTFFGRLAAFLIPEVRDMSQHVDDLTASVATLKTQVSAVKVVADTLKGKLDAAIADNVRLQAELDAALANAADPTDAPAIEQATADIQAANQTLADTAAVDAPAN
jgi:hypothetical protein